MNFCGQKLIFFLLSAIIHSDFASRLDRALGANGIFPAKELTPFGFAKMYAQNDAQGEFNLKPV